MEFLVDADFLIALVKEDDKNHLRSINKLRGLEDALCYLRGLGRKK
ncbi:hypothetical protein J7J18_05910 [bacterium]|nr:hypothetical protein [bacterium]